MLCFSKKPVSVWKFPCAWLMISWHYIWPRVQSVAQRTFEACCSGSRDRRHTVSSELLRDPLSSWLRAEAQVSGVCVSVCAPLDLSGMNNAWNSYGAEGETISSSTLIKKMLVVTLSLSIWWRCSNEINKMQTNVFLTNRLLLIQWQILGWNYQKRMKHFYVTLF